MSDAPAPPDGGVLDAAGFAALSGATAAQVEDLRVVLERLTWWNERINLVGASTLPAFWSRHAWDSAQLLQLAPDSICWADLGAGAGFPGLVLAALLKGVPGAQVHLVESLAKRCRFLTEVVEQLELPAVVHNARAEALKLKVDVVTARAVAPLPRLLEYAAPYFNRGASGLFLKSSDVAVEIEDARKTWTFDADIVLSRSDSRGRILRIKRLVRAAKT